MDAVEVIVRPRCHLRHRGRTYLPGERLTLDVESFRALALDSLTNRGVVRPVNLAVEVEDAVARGLPAEGYSAPNGPDDEPEQDPADPESVRRRTAAKHAERKRRRRAT
jgi:hypothetical protein